MHELLFFMIGVLLGGIIALLALCLVRIIRTRHIARSAMCLVRMIRSSDTQISRRDGDDK